MKAREYSPADYPMVSAWWKARGLPAVQEVVLPKCGIVVESDEGVPAAAAWVYFDNSTPMAWLAWLVTEPGLVGARADATLAAILGAATVAAKAQRRLVLFTDSPRPSLTRWLLAEGFLLNHESAAMLAKFL